MSLGERIRKALDENVYQSALWKSIFRHGYPDGERTRVLAVTSNVLLHLHPPKLGAHALRLRYTWCMGGLAALLFVHLTVTGVLLMFCYRPTPEHAYQDIVALGEDVRLGLVLRNLHRWAAHAMVVVVWLHMLRVFLTGSYKKPREFNWVVGVSLLVLTLLLSFTGYLLPWDQLSLWAVTVGTNMIGAAPFIGHQGPGASLLERWITPESDIRYLLTAGTTVGPATLLRFYVLHCVFLPLLTVGLMVLHFWRVRKDGFSGPL
jgi:quinol-cytochrome oxidoreductase complex cytochrome b subunit